MNHTHDSNNEKSSAPPMFELVGLHGRITLDNVYLNGLHALREMEVVNHSDKPILVKMRSNLRNQIAFQLQNENINNLPDNSDLDKSTTTNTVDWSRTAEEYPFNQLFNYINYIDQIELEPKQHCSFILAFLPETFRFEEDSHEEVSNDFDISSMTNGSAINSQLDEDSETYSMFNVTGSLFFFGYYNSKKGPITADRHHAFLDSDTQKDVLSTSSLADYQLSIKFRASVCRSTLWTDIAETGLNFDDCVLGETYGKDFTIQNRSEIDLYWLLNTIDLYNLEWLQFVDAETGKPLDNNEPISSYSSKQIQMLFMPKEVGEFNYDLQVENANDSRNVVQTKVHATVRSVLRKETLIVSSGNVVDFGDCISGTWAVQQIVLTNVSESSVEVRFLPEGAEVIFDIKQDTTDRAESHTEIADQRTNSVKQKTSSQSSSRTGGLNTPMTTNAGFSEASAVGSELSSRSVSPTLTAHTLDNNDRPHSSLLSEPPAGYHLNNHSYSNVPKDSDSDIGMTSFDGNAFTETSSVTDSIETSPATGNTTTVNTATTALSTTESYTRIEDFVLKPGTERVIQVSHRPQKDISINDFNAGQLIRRNFRFCLEYGVFRAEGPKERKVIQCRARTCTSFVETIPKVINFGDTDVGTLKSLPINIFNRSDIVARVELQFSSKVLNCLRGEITIQPRSYVELKLDLYPRKVNPDYRKQITLVNFLNKENDQIIEVHSNNIDKNRVTFHSLFYRILTATGANFLDFGSIALNSPALRTFTVENIRDKPLSLEITSSLPDDIAIYTRNKSKHNERTDNASTTSAYTSILATTVTTATTNITQSEQSNVAKTEKVESKNVPTDVLHKTHHALDSTRRRSKLLLEAISSRHIAKPSSPTTDVSKTISESEATNIRRTSNAKNDLMIARKYRNALQQLKMDVAHSSTAYLDLALPPVRALKMHRRKMIQINADLDFLTTEPKKTYLRPETGDKKALKSDYHTKPDQHHSRSKSASKKPSPLGANMDGKKHSGPVRSLNSFNDSHSHLHDDSLKDATATITSTDGTTTKKRIDASLLNNHTHRHNYGTRSVKNKRSLGITAARYKSRKSLDWSDITGKSRVPFEDLISVLEHGSKAAPPLFPKQSAEEQFVRYQIAWRSELDRLVKKGILVRASVVDVDPKGEEEVVIVITPAGLTKPHIQSAPKKQDARIFLRLLQFDRDIEQTEFENLLDLDKNEIPVREVILRAQLVRSVMDLGQKNINFSIVERYERHVKTIILHNRSETPLLYAIRKSGSIASGDIDLDVGRYGVVRSYGKREVDFVFEPTLSGPFMEKLVIENIRDRSNDQILLLKAQVRKPPTFTIKSMEMSFGNCLVDKLCQRSETIVLTNTNKQSRMFEVRVDPNEVIFGCYYAEFEFDVKEDDTNTISKEAEEEIENLEQKLKIAQRKAQPDKVKKYLRKLAKLKNLESENEDSDPESKAESKAESKVETKTEMKTKTKTETKTEAKIKAKTGSKKGDTDEKKKAKPDKESKSEKTAANISAAPSTSSSTSTTNNSLKESNLVFKKTSESVVFPLEPHASKTISVTFRPVLRPFKPTEEPDEQELNKAVYVKGRILAHEYKNTDVCKSIVYTAEVHSNEADYAKALAAKADGASVSDVFARDSITNTNTLPSIVAKEEEVEAPIAEEPLKLERAFFDAGRVELNQKTIFYAKVSNKSSQPIGFELISQEGPSVFDFHTENDENTKELQPEETRKIQYGLLPTQVGKQRYTFNVKNKKSGVLQPFTIQCLVHLNSYLEFPSLADEPNGVLDLGYSYVDPGSKYSQVTPLLVSNISEQDVFITCQSNLSHQVLIFMDETGKHGLVEMMPLKRASIATVWVAVQPNLLTGYLGNSADETRELVGGIKFSVYEKDQTDCREEGKETTEEGTLFMLSQTVKFTSVIGQSHLEVSDRIINLGYTDLLQKDFYGVFTIKNKSCELPLDYKIECESSNVALDRRYGTLDGWREPQPDRSLEYLENGVNVQRKSSIASLLNASDTLDDSDVESAQKSRREYSQLPADGSHSKITFRMNSYKYGLLNEKITVTNKRNSQEVFEINIRLFVDCRKLSAWTFPSKKALCNPSNTNQIDHDSNAADEHPEAGPLPLIKWESVYVCAAPQKNKDETVLQLMDLPENDTSRLYVREIDIENTSDQPMQLTVMSDIDVTAGFVVDEDRMETVAVQDKKNLFVQRSGQLLLQPGQHTRAYFNSPSTEKLDEEGRLLALHGQNSSLKGLMVLHDANQNLEVLAVELKALFCVSYIELSTDRIKLGKIGHSTSFKPTKFEFEISNLADIPATYHINAPAFISFTPLDKNGVTVEQKAFYIPSRKSQRVEGLLYPDKMPDQTSGLHRFDVRVDNLRNNSNVMHLHLKAIMTVFELKFERLSNNGEIVLPTLHHPITLPNAPCDNWFIIHNKTDEDLRFEIGADVEPELDPYVSLEVLSRYTNSPLKGDIAIGPQGSIEVRVRASPNETSRLPSNRPDFTNSDGIVMAKLWVTTSLAEEDGSVSEEKTRMKEMIPVRCVLEETVTFALSDRRLDFKLVTYYQDNSESGKLDGINNACMPESRPLTVMNNANKVPLRFKVTVEGPPLFPAHEMVMIRGLDEEGCGKVEPGESMTLHVAISNHKEGMPGQLQIYVDDLDALGESRQNVSLYLTEIVWDL